MLRSYPSYVHCIKIALSEDASELFFYKPDLSTHSVHSLVYALLQTHFQSMAMLLFKNQDSQCLKITQKSIIPEESERSELRLYLTILLCNGVRSKNGDGEYVTKPLVRLFFSHKSNNNSVATIIKRKLLILM